MRWSEEELEDKLKDNEELKVALPPDNLILSEMMKIEETKRYDIQKKPSKYRAMRTEYNGVLYDSKKEAKEAETLDLRIAGKEVLYWLRQVPFRLPGKIVYRVDFQVFYPNGEVRYFDVKGMDTPLSKLKRRQVEALFPVLIEILK